MVQHRRRADVVDDSGVVTAMAAAGDPDVDRWLTLRLQRRLAWGALLTAVALFAVWLPGTWRWIPMACTLTVLPVVAVARTVALAATYRGSPPLRRLLRRRLRTAGAVLDLGGGALLAAIGVAGLVLGRAADTLLLGAALGALLWYLAILGTIRLRSLRTFAAVIPDARAVVTGFLRVRTVLSVAVLAGAAVVLPWSAVHPAGPLRLWVAATGVAALAAVAAAWWVVRPRTRLDAVVTRGLVSTSLRWPVRAGLLALPAFFAPMLPVAGPAVGGGLLAVAAIFGPWLLWTRGTDYLPGFPGAQYAARRPAGTGGRPAAAPGPDPSGAVLRPDPPPVGRLRRSLHRWCATVATCLLLAALVLVATATAPAGPVDGGQDRDAVRVGAVLLLGCALLGALAAGRVLTRLPRAARRPLLALPAARRAALVLLVSGVLLPLAAGVAVLAAPPVGAAGAAAALAGALGLVAASVTAVRRRAALDRRVRAVLYLAPATTAGPRGGTAGGPEGGDGSRGDGAADGAGDEELLTTWPVRPPETAPRSSG
ncbi:hypothetical protein GCM10011594_27700 [Nakamurella endophytica]|uniref:Uncharacterized protein n=1 Tax=Nakamurella endophytica TaxID=1748367 RepID=A0A917WI81_9ACTN|nr:hypothetical protein GCM10011594_27700 [Nakamurella endophytica]